MKFLDYFAWVWYVGAVFCFLVACATHNNLLALVTLLPLLVWVMLLRNSKQ